VTGPAVGEDVDGVGDLGDGHELDRPAKSVEILGDRWCLLLVGEMLRWVDRFNELERSVPGSPGRCWPNACGTLEREGVVDRQVADDGPPSLVRALPRWFRLRP
jgi:DNA-binding HxlR family transcriptional regulator